MLTKFAIAAVFCFTLSVNAQAEPYVDVQFPSAKAFGVQPEEPKVPKTLTLKDDKLDGFVASAQIPCHTEKSFVELLSKLGMDNPSAQMGDSSTGSPTFIVVAPDSMKYVIAMTMVRTDGTTQTGFYCVVDTGVLGTNSGKSRQGA